MFNFFRNYLFSNSDGLIGKINQHLDNFQPSYNNNILEPKEAIENNLIK